MADDTYSIVRATVIDAQPHRVYEQIVDFHHWTNWSPWEALDPGLQRSYAGSTFGVGAVYTWSGNRRAGQGRMTITDVVTDEQVSIDLVFEKPWKAQNVTIFAIEPEGAGSRVTWSLTGQKTLMTRLMGLVKSMDKLIGPDFEKGLAQLKATAEAGRR